jgi:hypothetical protein
MKNIKLFEEFIDNEDFDGGMIDREKESNDKTKKFEIDIKPTNKRTNALKTFAKTCDLIIDIEEKERSYIITLTGDGKEIKYFIDNVGVNKKIYIDGHLVDSEWSPITPVT